VIGDSRVPSGERGYDTGAPNSTRNARSLGITLTIPLEQRDFASDPRANRLVKENLSAFLMAAAIDRGGQALELWNLPYKLQETWGHLDTTLIKDMDPARLKDEESIARAPSQIARLHLARTIVSVAAIIENDYGGDPGGIFEGSADQIIARLDGIFGVAEGIARMIVIQRLLYFGLILHPGGKGLLPKLDVQVQRVFTRSGLVQQCADHQVRIALTNFNNVQIAVVDQVAWLVGRDYCFPLRPDCQHCPLERACEKLGIEQTMTSGN
jgi:endonuclease III